MQEELQLLRKAAELDALLVASAGKTAEKEVLPALLFFVFAPYHLPCLLPQRTDLHIPLLCVLGPIVLEDCSACLANSA